ncbi:hypothetical protein B5X24_HaOG207504 [Helicoverpa armigera]|nr:hypothetical protein B5X24_HaOG207504 [Helicoverpa armigera]
MFVMTRKATAKDMEVKLKLALEKLKTSEELCQQLLRERDDSEEEIQKVISKNSELKSQLAELHIQYMDVLDQRDRLQDFVGSFSECSDAHERALSRIKELETSLNDAHKSIICFKQTQQQQESDDTQRLFSELVTSNSLHINNLSHKKIKKYIRINKLIQKIKKVCHKQKSTHKLHNLLKTKVDLKNQLNLCTNQLLQSRLMYDQDTLVLQQEMLELQRELTKITHKYETAQYQVKAHILATDELLQLGSENMDRLDSLKNKYTNCTCSQPAVQADPELTSPSTMQSAVSSDIIPPVVNVQCNIPPSSISYNNNSENQNNISQIFSDRFGLGFGKLISQYCKSKIINNCSPGASYNEIIETIKLTNLNTTSTAIMLFGDSLAVKKQNIIESVESMIKLNNTTNCKFIICALPYSKNFTIEQNQYIFNLNLLMYNITRHYNNRIMYFDTNKFINNFVVTNDTMYLSFYYKRQIAILIANNIQIDPGSTTVTSSFNNISSSTNTTIDTPDSLNYMVRQRVGHIN